MTLDQIPFPFINACLNGTSAALLLVGYVLIKFKAIRAHKFTMFAAVGTSVAFLACYITYHIHHYLHGIGVTRFPTHPTWKPIYLAILFSHTTLAIVILPLIGFTLWYAHKEKWNHHKKIAVITFPLWLYVSVTGVVIYRMLYHLAKHL